MPPATLPGNAVDLSPDLSFPGSGLGMPDERLCLFMNELVKSRRMAMEKGP